MHSAKSLLSQSADRSAWTVGPDERLHEALHSLEQVEREQRFLAEAGEALASSLDYHETLNMVAHLAAGSISNFCVVEVIGEDGRFQPIASEDEDDVHCRELCAAVDSARPEAGAPPVLAALESNDVVVIPILPLEDEHAFFRALRAMGAVSLIVAPMVARGHALGVVLLASRPAGRPYGEKDAPLARELARRAAIAVDNARLYEKAQRALRARDEMLSIVAHDLRNPLGVISMSAELIADGVAALPAPVTSGLERIRRSTEQMNRLIQDLLDVSKMDAGKLTLQREPLSPSELLNEAAYMLRPLAEQGSLALIKEVDPDLPTIPGDRARLLQALGNLVANSIKFTTRGGTITIAARRHADGVCFSVTDTGKGVAPENLPHLFDRFWQERPTDARGLGLGLAIVKGIVDGHGGRINVESELGRGTSVAFVLATVRSQDGVEP